MLIENCLLTIATKNIQETNLILENQTLSSLYLELTLTLNLTEAYLKTRSSVYWKHANKATRQRVNLTLNKLLDDILFHINNSKSLFNNFCSEQEKSNANVNPEIWANLEQFKYKFQSFESLLNKEHEHKNVPYQLSLKEALNV